MKILIYTHFYFPETGAASVRMQYFVNALKAKGYDVEVITPLPNYPLGKIFDGYPKFFKRDNLNKVAYLPVYVPRKHSLVNRGLSYLSFFLSSFLYALFYIRKPDVIISSSPPISTSLAAALIARIKGSKFLFDIRDVWPDIGIQLGLLRKGLIISVLKKIEKFILNSAFRIIVTAGGDKKNITGKGYKDSLVEVIYNGADTKLFVPLNQEERITIRNKYEIPQNKIVLIYFGSFNYGMNDIELLGDVLCKLENIKDNVFFVAVGDGDNRKDFMNSLRDKIKFKHFKSLDTPEIAKILAASDISLIPRKKIAIDTGGNIPVKIFESWAAEIPVVLSVNNNTEAARIFDECGAGIRVEAGNVEFYFTALKKMIDNPDKKMLGEKGRTYVVENFDRIKQTSKLLKIISQIKQV